MPVNPPLDPRTVELLRLTAAALEGADPVPKYVIGGGIALLTHGIARHTSDVDVFVPLGSRGARGNVLALLRNAGLEVAQPLLTSRWHRQHRKQHESRSDTDPQG